MNQIQQSIDYLIIGQGLAGTFLAHELDKQGHSFLLIDNPQANASKTAAGIYNPVVLKRFSPVWQAQEQVALAKKTLAELSDLLGVVLDYPLPVWRVFHHENERATWLKKAENPSLSRLLSPKLITAVPPVVRAPLGCGQVNLSGRADSTALLQNYRVRLQKKHRLIAAKFHYKQLEIYTDRVVYQGIEAKKLVFCEGFGLRHNPFFGDLPLVGNKGEVLEVHAPGLELPAIIKSAVFIMPLATAKGDLSDSDFFIGSTYDWHDKTEQPTAEAKNYLLEKLSALIQTTFTVTEHRAAIRPTVVDRRPLLGQHRQYAPLYVLNGLGTRGIMLGPMMATLLYDFIEKKQPLPEAVDIKRFH